MYSPGPCAVLTENLSHIDWEEVVADRHFARATNIGSCDYNAESCSFKMRYVAAQCV